MLSDIAAVASKFLEGADAATLAINAVAVMFVYFYFCVMANDDKGRAHYYMEVRPGEFYGPTTLPDRDFKLVGVGAAIPTALLVLTALYNRQACSFEAELVSRQTLLAAITVYLLGKIFNGPGAEVRKGVQLLDDGSTRRPLSFMISDALLVIPGNLLRGWVWKIPVVAILGILYVLDIRTNSSTFYYFSSALIVVWVLLCLGRLASIIVHRQFAWGWQPVLYIAMALACAVVWDLMDTSLKGCGVKPDALPGFSTFLLR